MTALPLDPAALVALRRRAFATPERAPAVLALRDASEPARGETAIEVWNGLVSGRWSLVDQFDADGRRFVLAVKNPPSVDRRAHLTPRERRACALAAAGHCYKQIAHVLGISFGSVAATLSQARAKLGVRSRVELITLWLHGEQ